MTSNNLNVLKDLERISKEMLDSLENVIEQLKYQYNAIDDEKEKDLYLVFVSSYIAGLFIDTITHTNNRKVLHEKLN